MENTIYGLLRPVVQAIYVLWSKRHWSR